MGNIEKFNAVASAYDTPERIRIAKIISAEIRKHVVNCNEKTAIDFGCGTGLVGLDLLDVFKSILFIDASQNMVEQVTNKIEKMNISNAKARYYDLMVDNTFDLKVDYIIVSQTLLHIMEVEFILSRLYGLLNEGGHLLIIDFDINNDIVSSEVHNGFDQGELVDILKNIGFKSAESETFYHGEKIFMNKDASIFILDASR